MLSLGGAGLQRSDGNHGLNPSPVTVEGSSGRTLSFAGDMRLLSSVLDSLRDDSAQAGMVSHELLCMPTIVTVSPLALPVGDVEIIDHASGERSVRPMEDVEAELRGAA
jgi:hypothetical protein